MSQLILVADDNENNRIVFAAMLTHHGFGVRLAGDGAEAVEAAYDHPPALVLLDLHMPLLNGWEVIAALRARDQTKKIPVLAVTADATTAIGNLQAAGFCGYLRMPLLPSTLVEAVTRCLSREPVAWIEVPHPTQGPAEALIAAEAGV